MKTDKHLMLTVGDINGSLSIVQGAANALSTCEKVKVGAAIVDPTTGETVFGVNHGIGYTCTNSGCLRKKLYGEASKDHRLPSDCAAIHAEIDAITKAARRGINTYDCVLWVTRYPCEACARAIVNAGIKHILYGRKEPISKMTEDILRDCEVIHCDWDYEDDNR